MPEGISHPYPPLKPLAEYPLHSEPVVYACQRPEDPSAHYYDWRCPNCLLAAQAYVENFGDIDADWRPGGAELGGRIVKLSWLIERTVYWLYEVGEDTV